MSSIKSKTTRSIDFAVGGQALIEGVLMRSPNFNIISVRTPEGEISEKSEFYQNIIQRFKFFNIPLLRGVINMFEMMLIGTKALNFSSSITLGGGDAKKTENGFWVNFSVIFSTFLGLGLAIALFKFVPLWLTSILSSYIPSIEANYLLFNFVDAFIKTSIFVGYISLMALIPDIKRVFMYHGAEHKSIMTYEYGLELNVENARQQTRFHPRCGTSFIIIVFLISILVFTLIPKNPDFITNFFTRLLALPFIAGISYELLKYSAKLKDNTLLGILAAPGLLMQKITTQEPDDKMLEVALNSLKLALKSEENYQKQKHVL
jgi:uncharacterized protein YqhQ